MAFTGFTAATFGFLQELQDNNNRPWFAENKHRYEELVLNPALDFIVAMGPRLARISSHIDAIPKRQGGSLMRVYRDTRFGKDKTPYKTNIGIQFRHSWGKDVHAPGFYCHIDTENCFLAAGMWRPDSQALAAIRARIDARPREWSQVLADRGFKRNFELGGDSLKRPPRGYPQDHPMIDSLKRKDFIAVCGLAAEDVQGPRFADKAGRVFAAGDPLMQFLCKSIEAPY